MVCEECQPKLSRVIVPDKWKDGARNVISSSSSRSSSSTTSISAGVGGPIRAGKTNKALEKLKVSNQWIPQDRHCRICKGKVLAQMNYCNDCAHKRGICAMCGKKTVDVSSHRMSLV